MNIHSVTLSIISAPLKSPFMTHLETVTKREVIIIKAIDQDGNIGYGEAVPFSSPWYTEETIQTCKHLLEDFLIPSLLKIKINHPAELENLWNGIRRNAMAKSGLEQALWDLYAKQQGVYLGKLFGGVRKEVAAGIVIAAPDIQTALQQIEDVKAEGYERYKVKLHRNSDIELLTEIRKTYPTINLMADANSAYTLNDVEHLKEFDAFNLMMIEQPLGNDDIVEHAILQKQLTTPVCLDESICSFQDAKSALMLSSCEIINIKMSRVGGWNQAVKIHDLCLQEQIPVWCGGMIEFGISRAHNLALASLPGFTIPGDLAPSSRYWSEDIIEPEVIIHNGKITVPSSPGIGFAVDEERVDRMSIYKQAYKK